MVAALTTAAATDTVTPFLVVSSSRRGDRDDFQLLVPDGLRYGHTPITG